MAARQHTLHRPSLLFYIGCAGRTASLSHLRLPGAAGPLYFFFFAAQDGHNFGTLSGGTAAPQASQDALGTRTSASSVNLGTRIVRSSVIPPCGQAWKQREQPVHFHGVI